MINDENGQLYVGLLRKTSLKRGLSSRFLKLRMKQLCKELGNGHCCQRKQQRQQTSGWGRLLFPSYMLTKIINVFPPTTHRNTVVTSVNLIQSDQIWVGYV